MTEKTEPNKTLTFYKDNRLDQKFDITPQMLKAKFDKWREDNPLKRDNWPFERQADVFLMDIGSYDKDQVQRVIDALQGKG